MEDSSGVALSRRAVLAGVVGTTASLAGCLGDDSDGGDGVSEGSDEVPVRGEEDAPVRLEVYTDFACPACADYEAQFDTEIVQEYVETGDIRYQHRDYIGPVEGIASWQAASAAREVYLEHTEAFWEYRSRLFDRQEELAEDSGVFRDIAETLGLEDAAVQSAAEDRAHDSKAKADTTRGDDLGIPGRPGFVIDGAVVNPGNVGLEELVGAVRDELDQTLANTEGRR